MHGNFLVANASLTKKEEVAEEQAPAADENMEAEDETKKVRQPVFYLFIYFFVEVLFWGTLFSRKKEI